MRFSWNLFELEVPVGRECLAFDYDLVVIEPDLGEVLLDNPVLEEYVGEALVEVSRVCAWIVARPIRTDWEGLPEDGRYWKPEHRVYIDDGRPILEQVKQIRGELGFVPTSASWREERFLSGEDEAVRGWVVSFMGLVRLRTLVGRVVHRIEPPELKCLEGLFPEIPLSLPSDLDEYLQDCRSAIGEGAWGEINDAVQDLRGKFEYGRMVFSVAPRF